MFKTLNTKHSTKHSKPLKSTKNPINYAFKHHGKHSTLRRNTKHRQFTTRNKKNSTLYNQLQSPPITTTIKSLYSTQNTSVNVAQPRILPIKVTNSLTNQLEALTIRHSTPLDSSFTSQHLHSGYNNALTWYVCGPTVYDASHIGHARTYTNFDMMRRIISHYHQIPLIFAMGVTDIDDKIITRSKEKGISWLTLARHFENEFNNDLQHLNILPPDMSLRVSEFIPDIISYIQQLSDRDLTYTTNDGVYFDVQKFSQRKHLYGKLRYSTLYDAAKQVQEALTQHDTSLFDEDASQPPPQPLLQQQGDDDHNNNNNEKPLLSTPVGHAEKRHPADFCLWKYQKSPLEPSFESQFGIGRPGWHIECSAMTASALGVGIDIHSGGVDLKFPHHCNEIAQAEGCLGWGEDHLTTYSNYNNKNHDNNATNKTNNSIDSLQSDNDNNNTSKRQNWTTTWIHTGHLNIHGHKMSKSLKNFITIQELFKDGYTSDEFRMLCATTPYNSTLDYTTVRLQQCRQEIKNIVNFKEFIKRTIKSNQRTQLQQYNETLLQNGQYTIDINHFGEYHIVKNKSSLPASSSSSQPHDESNTNINDNNDKTYTSIPHIDYAFTKQSADMYEQLQNVYLHKSTQIRPNTLEYELQQQFISTQGLIHNYLSNDFNTQQTISSLSLLMSTTTKYINDKTLQYTNYKKKQQTEENNNDNDDSTSLPNVLLLTQISTYISKLYNMLGFQFAGALGGNWNNIATQLTFNGGYDSSNNNNTNVDNTNQNQITVKKDEDGIPIYLHELATQRHQLKQVAVQGSKLIKKMSKSVTPNSDNGEQVVMDKALYTELLNQLQNQSKTMLGVCDNVRDNVFIGAGFTLKDTASAGGNNNSGNNAQSSYFIRQMDQFDVKQ